FRFANLKYENGVRRILRRRGVFLTVYVIVVIALAWLFVRVPKSFLPDEDQGIMFVQVTTPPGTPMAQTNKVLDDIAKYFLTEEKDSVDGIFTVAGFSFAGQGQNSGIGFVRLKDWTKRPNASQNVKAIAGRAMGHLMQMRSAMAFAFAPPAVIELGNAT